MSIYDNGKAKKLVSCVLSAALLVGILFSTGVDVSAAKKPKLAKKKISVKVGKKATIKVKNCKKKVKWKIKSGKKFIKIVKKKKKALVIKGKKAGTAKIIAKIGKKKLKCTIKVKKKGSNNASVVTSSNPYSTYTTFTESPIYTPVSFTESPIKTYAPTNTDSASSSNTPATSSTPKVSNTPIPMSTSDADSSDGSLTVDSSYYTVGSKVKLKVGMSENEMKSACSQGSGSLKKMSNNSPQGYTVYTYTGPSYESFGLMYVNGGNLVSIFFVSGIISYKNLVNSGSNANSLSSFSSESWLAGDGGYLTSDGDVKVCAFGMPDGSNRIYGILACSSSIYDSIGYPDNNNYTSGNCADMVSEVEGFIKAYSVIISRTTLSPFEDPLAEVAQAYADSISSNKNKTPSNRSHSEYEVLFDDAGYDWTKCNEYVYYGLGDAIGMFGNFVGVTKGLKVSGCNALGAEYKYFGVGISGFDDGKSYLAMVVDCTDYK